MSGGAGIEFQYAEPFAEALCDNSDFRKWVLGQTGFARFENVRLLRDEMVKKRSPGTPYWWRHYYTHKCTCPGCDGRETDIFAIFETDTGFRFALHIEVKHPSDKFKAGGNQASAYPIRAQCWANKPPEKVLRHDAATTVLLFSEGKRKEFSEHLDHFKTLITIEDVDREFPQLYDGLEIAGKQ
jgi:hypothetical protein